MTVTLGGITLSDDLILTGIEAARGIAINQRRSLAGRSLCQVAPCQGGRSLTLSGENHFTLEQITAIKALAAAGQPVILVHHRGTFTVLIIDTPVSQTINYANPTATDWFTGDIQLLEV